jgi:hypothetical protein
MMNFTDHALRLEHINTRTENHGEDERLCLDLKISFDLPNNSLDTLSPTLRRSLYDAADTPDMIDPDATPHLRNPQLGTLHWSGKWSPVVFMFRDGDSDDEDEDLRFTDAKLDKVSVLPQDGGTCHYTARVQVYPEDGDEGGRILDLLHAPGVRGTLEVTEDSQAGDAGDGDE